MDIEIFPHRLLSADTTEGLLNNLEGIEGIKRIVIQGQRLPPKDVNQEQRTITLKGEEIDLQIQTGRILMDIEDEGIIDESIIKASVRIIYHLDSTYMLEPLSGNRKQLQIT
jgi:methyl-coenzyme M reductase subunit D